MSLVNRHSRAGGNPELDPRLKLSGATVYRLQRPRPSWVPVPVPSAEKHAWPHYTTKCCFT